MYQRKNSPIVNVLLWVVMQTGKTREDRTLTFTEFLNDVEAGKVKSVSITGGEVRGAVRVQQLGARLILRLDGGSKHDRRRFHWPPSFEGWCHRI